MSYPDQLVRTKRLQKAVNASLDQIKQAHKAKLMGEWKACRRDLIGAIAQAYKIAAPSGKWNSRTFRASGARGWLRSLIQRRLVMFQASSVAMMRHSFKDIRRQSVLRHAWLLDQVTPDSKTVRLPDHAMREASAPGDPEIWVDKVGQWVESYESALANNLSMHALNEGDLSGAVDEVDATRMNTPASTIENALSRLFDYQAAYDVAEGEDEIARLNDELITEEIWMTSGRANICDDCAGNEGKTVDEVDGDIPLHPNCGCFWEAHPKKYGDLLRSGTPEDRAAAEEMERRGTDGGALVIRGADGEIAAKVVVSFQEWMNSVPGVLTGGAA